MSEQNAPTLSEKAEQYVNKELVDYGDLTEQAEEQLKDAYSTGYRKAILDAINETEKFPFSMLRVLIKEKILNLLS